MTEKLRGPSNTELQSKELFWSRFTEGLRDPLLIIPLVVILEEPVLPSTCGTSSWKLTRNYLAHLGSRGTLRSQVEGLKGGWALRGRKKGKLPSLRDNQASTMSPYVATLILLSGLLDLSSVEQATASLRHFHHRHRLSDYDLEESVPRQVSLNRRWRSVDSFVPFESVSQIFKVEAKQSNYDSLCGYVVTPKPPILDRNGNVMVKDLNEIKCRNLGDPCYAGGSHCCIQTYMNITIMYSDEPHDFELETIYTGCVCAHRRREDATPELNTLR